MTLNWFRVGGSGGNSGSSSGDSCGGDSGCANSGGNTFGGLLEGLLVRGTLEGGVVGGGELGRRLFGGETVDSCPSPCEVGTGVWDNDDGTGAGACAGACVGAGIGSSIVCDDESGGVPELPVVMLEDGVGTSVEKGMELLSGYYDTLAVCVLGPQGTCPQTLVSFPLDKLPWLSGH